MISTLLSQLKLKTKVHVYFGVITLKDGTTLNLEITNFGKELQDVYQEFLNHGFAYNPDKSCKTRFTPDDVEKISIRHWIRNESL